MKVQGTILRNTFSHRDFRDIGALVKLKGGRKISLAFPTLNEEETIGKEILVLKTELMDRFPLLDEIAVIDSGSTDRTREIAAGLGARVHASRGILRRYGTHMGKGENLWKSLHVLDGDIIVWIDADIRNIAPKFVYGLVGPLLTRPEISYVKAFYDRPFQAPGGLLPSGGGRVTEILVRPLFSLFFPELACLIQPLSGEYAGRRSVLERIPFSVGYGVEIGHLIDIFRALGPQAIAQVNLDARVHRNQTVQALSRMSFGILTTFLRRLDEQTGTQLREAAGALHLSVTLKDRDPRLVETEIASVERPPMMEIEEYRKARHPGES